MNWIARNLQTSLLDLGQSKDIKVVRELFERTHRLFLAHKLTLPSDRAELIQSLCDHMVESSPRIAETFENQRMIDLVSAIFDYEKMYVLPKIDWSKRRKAQDWRKIGGEIHLQYRLLNNYAQTTDQVVQTLENLFAPVTDYSLSLNGEVSPSSSTTNSTSYPVRAGDLADTISYLLGEPLSERCVGLGLFGNLRRQIARNLVSASGGNPDDPSGFKNRLIPPKEANIENDAELIATYLSGTPLTMLFSEVPGVATSTRGQK